MRTTVIIEKRDPGYISTVSGRFGDGPRGASAGNAPDEAAATAARLMLEFAKNNPEGGDLVAPKEVMKLVPKHLHHINRPAHRPTKYGEPLSAFIRVKPAVKGIAQELNALEAGKLEQVREFISFLVGEGIKGKKGEN